MGLLRKPTRLRNFLDRSSLQEPQPHPEQDNETPVGASVAEGGGREARREKKTRKRKRFWRWRSIRKKYNVAEAERLNQTVEAETGTHQSHCQGVQEVVPVAEYQPEQEVIQLAVLDTPVRLPADDGAESPMCLSADNSIHSAESPKAERDIACAVRPKAKRDIACAVRPKAERDIACAVRPKAERDIACAVRPKAERDIACAVRPKAERDIACAVRPKAERNIVCAVCPKAERDIACAVRPKAERDFASAVRPKEDEGIASTRCPKVDRLGHPNVDGVFASSGHHKKDKGIASKGRPEEDKGIASKGHPKVDMAGRPKVDGGIASARHAKEEKGIASRGLPLWGRPKEDRVGRPKEGNGIASKRRHKLDKAARPEGDGGIASPRHSKEEKGIASKGCPKEDKAGCPRVDGRIASAVRTPKIGSSYFVPTGELDKDYICLRYKFGGRLGEGGFGSVRKGIRYKDGLKVAVKYVKKTKDTSYITTAFHPKPLPLEIALVVIVNREPSCPQIIQLLDWHDAPDYYLIVMERPVPSMDLATFLKCSGGAINEQISRYIIWQTIYAVNFCCYRSVFHRDIKLQNVLVNPTTLEIKIIDFGCGDLMKDSGYTAFCGTKSYFAPEYFDRGRYHAKPATVYSLGVLLFAMLHGHFPTAQDLFCLGNNQSAFAVSKECIHFLWSCLQRHPDCRIHLEQMLFHDWFELGFPNCLPIYQNASKQHLGPR